MACCGCGCFNRCKPRYRRLVDSIFPPDPNDGIVSANMVKLTFYALSAPEKLDRIGAYLAQHLSRHIQRHRKGHVFVAMEALDELLKACHTPSLNLFVESFLRMVQLLLESSDPELQQLATRSFTTFANIEEDTPSYHRRYDFFISKFSAMCFSGDRERQTNKRQCLAGLQGLHGVIQKTVADELQVNIWEGVHMNKLVPALLFNMQKPKGNSSAQGERQSTAEDEEDDPAFLAESCLRDLVGRAGYGHLACVMTPLFELLESFELWVPNDFAKHAMQTVMSAVQTQYTYMVVNALVEYLDHMETQSSSSLAIRTSVVKVLGATVSLADGSSLGPSHLDVFKTLLRQLRLSVDVTPAAPSSTSTYGKVTVEELQEATIETVGVFANVLPGYVKEDIMTFICAKMPEAGQHEGSSDIGSAPATISRFTSEASFDRYRALLVRCVSKVCGGYTPAKIASSLSPDFVQPLLKHCLVAEPDVRVDVQVILHQLIDRHSNVKQLPLTVSWKNIDELELHSVKLTKEDVLFMKRHGSTLFWQLYEQARLANNTERNLLAIYRTLALLCLELGTDNTMVEMMRMVLGLQDYAMESEFGNKSIQFVARLHAFVALVMYFVAHQSQMSACIEHVEMVVSERRRLAPFLLPENCFAPDASPLSASAMPSSSGCFFSREIISRALTPSLGQSAEGIIEPYDSKNDDEAGGKSLSSDVQSIVNLSGGLLPSQPEKVTYKSLKAALEAPKSTDQPPSAPAPQSFDEMASFCQTKSLIYQSKLAELLEHLAQPHPVTGFHSAQTGREKLPPWQRIPFDDLLVL